MVTQQEMHVVTGFDSVVTTLETISQNNWNDNNYDFFVLIGSRACIVHVIELERDVRNSDWDVLMPSNNILSFLKKHSNLIKDIWARISPKKTTTTVSIILDQGDKIEITILLENFLSRNIWNELAKNVQCHSTTCKLPTGDECRVAPVAMLHVIKESHLHVSVDWEKHASDLNILRKHLTTEDFNSRFTRYEHMHNYKVTAAFETNNKPKIEAADDETELNVIFQNFSFEGVDIRKEITDNPLYFNFVVRPNIISRNKFCESSLEKQISCIVEEAMTTAIHDSLISLFPFDDEIASKMYINGLKTLCTSSNHYHWFTKIIISNFTTLCSAENTKLLYSIVERIIQKTKKYEIPAPDVQQSHSHEVEKNSEPYIVLYFLEELLANNYDSLVTLSLLNKAWNSYFREQKLWHKWYHKRWGNFSIGTAKTDWRARYKQRLQKYEEKEDKIKTFKQELLLRQFLNLRSYVSNLSMASIRGEVKDLTGALYVKEIQPHMYVYEITNTKVQTDGPNLHYFQRRSGAIQTKMEIALIGKSAIPLEFTILFLNYNSTYEYYSGDSDNRDYIQWYQIVVEGKDEMKKFKYQTTELQLPAVLFRAAKNACPIVGAEFNCPKMNDGDLFQYLIQLLPRVEYSLFMESVRRNLGSRY